MKPSNLRTVLLVHSSYRKRIYTEENAKVVTAVWGTEFIKLLAALVVLQKDDVKNRMTCTRMF